MPATHSQKPSRPKEGFLNRKVINDVLAVVTPEARLMFVVRCGMRIRGLMKHPLVGSGIDHMLSLGRKACLDPKVIDENFVAALKFLKLCVEDEGMPGVEDPENKETTPYKVEAVAVARVYDEIRHWHNQDNRNAIWTAGFAAAESEDAIRLMDVPDDQKSVWLDAHYRALMSDLDHAKSGKRTKTHKNSPDGPWGALWPERIPKWFEEAERARPLTSIKDSHNDILINHSHLKASWRTLEDILKHMTDVEKLRLPSREEPEVGERLVKEIAEFEASVRRVVQLIDADPAIAERLLPSLGVLAKRIQESGHLIRTKEVSEMLGISQTRVNQLAKSRKLESTEVLGISTFCRSQVEDVAKIDRQAGRPREK